MGSLVNLYRLEISSASEKGKGAGALEFDEGDEERLQGPRGPPPIKLFPIGYIRLTG